MAKTTTQEDFVHRSVNIHGNYYDYSQDSYRGMNERFKFVCPSHGDFYSTPSRHIHQSQGCKECAAEKKVAGNKISHTNKIYKIHQGQYEIVGWLNFKKLRDDVRATCRDHGEYLTTPEAVMRSTYGDCSQCKQLKEAKVFKAKAEKLHGNKYRYQTYDYICSRSLMSIYCTTHKRYFKQRPSAHLQGQGCPECGKKDAVVSSRMSYEDFVNKSISVHGDKYDYSKTVYKGHRNFCQVICPVHGKFKIKPAVLFEGCGCPKCTLEKRRTFYGQELLRKVKLNPHYQHLNFDKVYYTNNTTKVDVYCKDHEEWFKITPLKLLDPTRICGCRVCGKIRKNRWTISALLKIPDIKQTKGNLYFGKISGLRGVKVGITNNLVSRKRRYKQDLQNSPDVCFNYISTVEKDYFTCVVIETVLKKYFYSCIVKHELDFGGKNEIFDIQGHPLLEDIVSGVWDLEFQNLSNVVTSSNSKEINSMIELLKRSYKD